jgi:DNA-binding MarR family transcriptional regulator
MVVPTQSGRRLGQVLDRGIAVAEERFAEVVGTANVASIRRCLKRCDGIERLLIDTGRRFVRDVLESVRQRGYHWVTEAQMTLFRTLELEGSRLTDVATAGRITKQSMRPVVEGAERIGVVERAADPTDKRAKVIRFTPAGLVMLEEMRRGVMETEAAFATVHGDAFLHDLKAWLTCYVAAV